MSSFSAIPFIRFIPAFLVGIIGAFYSKGSEEIAVGVLAITLVYFLYALKIRYVFRFRFVNGIVFQFVFLSLGFLLVRFNDYPVSANQHVEFYQGIIGAHVIRNGRIRAEVEVELLSDKENVYAGREKILVYFPDDSTEVHWNDRLIFTGSCSEILPVKNPGQFDWKFYLSLKRIHKQLFLKKGSFVILPNNEFSIRRMAENVRNYLLETINSSKMDVQETAVVSALVLGYDDEIDGELMKAFSATGTLHILSVSGMHVSMVYTALGFLLRFMEKKKKWRIKRMIILVIFIWFYSLITGFTPSVIRSAMMFTIVLLAGAFSRKSNIYNSLMTSAMIIFIVLDPLLLFYPGFQLSFMAVAGIVYLYPLISEWYTPSSRILLFFWSIIAVSIAAQIGTLPISLFYFHQFPNYFLLSNLLILPLSTVIIFAGIALLFISPFPLLVKYLAIAINMLTSWMCRFAYFIQDLPFAVTNQLFINLFEMMLMYLFIVLLIYFLTNKSIPSLYASGLIIVIFLCGFIYRDVQSRTRNEWIVFSYREALVPAYLHGFTLYVFHSETDKIDALIDSYQSARRSVCRTMFLDVDKLKTNEYLSSGNLLASGNRIEINTTTIAVNEYSPNADFYFMKKEKGYAQIVETIHPADTISTKEMCWLKKLH